MSHNDIPRSLQNFLDLVNTKSFIYTPEEVRDLAEKTSEAFVVQPKTFVPLISDQEVKLVRHQIATRIYHPAPQKKLPLTFYFHGGGHLSGSIKTHDALCRRIAVASNSVVVSVGYRLAPEFPYPAGLLDCIAVFEQREPLLKDFQVNTEHVFLVGDSAGGNLAISVGHKMKERGDTAIKGLALIYPSVDFSMNYDSYQRNGTGFLLTREKIKWYFDNYFRNGDDRIQASPIYFKHLELLPPCYIAAAEYDPLFDEAITFAKKIEALGVVVQLEEFKGMIHIFAQLELFVPDQVAQLVASIGSFIKSLNLTNS
ncbi:alpha/beta hydrolase [Legionella longbeachae]|uniref:Putative alpha/beta hydrolase fold protein n=1 Tax=Legionella longbeachae serogroup 1 (strain NSW150) TaxID=661367 RepID=D3HR54_LEGLN|nr:alpha/beta hydrolase [Legionella longbeachae]VEE01891.1 alpha/beta hydrolase [Legionella oakridgensis]HBD7396857.1 alpha/beta hydrolase [Legionella pneumophila]ARB91791.1 alpha/beta hydrolase [Legionella longbeachae]ARM35063.1 alpha/beta hydrolase [Legionella longbeachae]EEZ95511.1 lipase [Legionella longbeachae D-4968]